MKLLYKHNNKYNMAKVVETIPIVRMYNIKK